MTCYRVLKLGILGLALSACSAGTPLDPEGVDPPVLTAAELCALQDGLVQAAGTAATPDDHFEILARLLPGGFGGLSLYGMFLVHPDRLQDARQVAATLTQCAGRHVAFLGYVAQSPVRQGQYDWLQLTAWRRRIETDHSFQLVFTDIDENVNRLGIGVPTEADRLQLLKRLSALGIPEAAVNVEVTVPPHPL